MRQNSPGDTIRAGRRPPSIESPQSNGKAEAFFKTRKRDYAQVSPRPEAASALHQYNGWFEHYNTVHSHKALGYGSPRGFRSHFVGETIKNAVDPRHRPHAGAVSTAAVGSSPKSPEVVARSARLDASAAMDQP